MEYHRSRRRTCHSVGKVTAQLLLSFLALSNISLASASASSRETHQAPLLLPSIQPIASHPSTRQGPAPHDHDFTLRHVFHHGAYLYPDLHRRLDVFPRGDVWTGSNEDEEKGTGPYRLQTNSINIQRLVDRNVENIGLMMSAARTHGEPPALPMSAWTVDEVLGPNITDKRTVVNLALMAANAYDINRNETEWEDVKNGFNLSDSFGWEGDGLRGHIFADGDNSTIVIAMKGTSPAVFDGAETTTNDKENDNLFFSCCCGQGGQYLWRQVCDCMTSAYTCNQTCVVRAVRQKNRYYQAALELYGNVTELYPDSTVFVAGHSLGGSVASLLALTFGLPAVTFEAPAQALAAIRLGLPSPPDVFAGAARARKYSGVYHFGHTADPIYMGTCNAATSGCTLGGYAMETQCHAGLRCVYDVVEDKKWRVSITTHSIRNTIRDVYRDYDEAASCLPDLECRDCALWNYFESNGSETTTSKTSTSTTTSIRTSTCSTPGWFGCLDETTTTVATGTTSTSSSATSTTTTVTCTHYGWFGGCLDPSSTTTSTTTLSTTIITPTAPSSTPATTTSCETPGLFFGCRDPTPAPSAHAITAKPGL